jgi:hypothetical protein
VGEFVSVDLLNEPTSEKYMEALSLREWQLYTSTMPPRIWDSTSLRRLNRVIRELRIGLRIIQAIEDMPTERLGDFEFDEQASPPLDRFGLRHMSRAELKLRLEEEEARLISLQTQEKESKRTFFEFARWDTKYNPEIYPGLEKVGFYCRAMVLDFLHRCLGVPAHALTRYIPAIEVESQRLYVQKQLVFAMKLKSSQPTPVRMPTKWEEARDRLIANARTGVQLNQGFDDLEREFPEQKEFLRRERRKALEGLTEGE